MSQYVDQFIEVDGVRVRYWASGERGPHLLLIHGLGAAVEYWQFILPQLSQHFRVIALDLPGFGKTSAPGTVDFSLSYFASFVKSFTDTLGLESFYLAGHSLGGGICLQLSLDYPGSVEKLFLINSVGFSLQVTIMFRLMSLPILGRFMLYVSKKVYARALRFSAHHGEKVSDAFVDEMYAIASTDKHRESMLKILRNNAGVFGMKYKPLKSIFDRLHTLCHLPVFVLWGDQDRLLNIQHLSHAKKYLSHAKTYVIHDCGHMPMIEFPEKTAQLMQDFFLSNQEAPVVDIDQACSLPEAAR
jgi:pimeloyl-ACP methyl ester carboxylesterase